jgi:hypothetical protein
MTGTRLHLMPTLAPVFTGGVAECNQAKARVIAAPNVQPRSF